MKIKETKELQTLAQIANMSVADFSAAVVAGLAHIIDEDVAAMIDEGWGETIKNTLDGKLPIDRVIEVMNAVGIVNVRYDNFGLFMGLILLGDGDCPECGGEMERTDGEEKRVGGDGWETPFEYATIWEERTCTNCGHVESDEPCDYEYEND